MLYFVESQCPVCLKKWTEGDKTLTISCKHTFHATCILPWFEKVRNLNCND